MQKELTRIELLRKLVRVLICIIYPLTLLWFVFCIFGGFIINRADYDTSIVTGQYVMIGFAVFVVAHYAFMFGFKALNMHEDKTMRDIISQLFPSAKYSPTGSVDPHHLVHSRLFGKPEITESQINSKGYGSLAIPVGNRLMTLADVGVTSANRNPSSINSPRMLYQYLVRPIFGARVESTMYSFRGMFGYCRLKRSFRGFVMLLPDHLENRIGYLSQIVQGIKQKHGAKFVHLEDPEFEKLFVVYADDEVEARMVLTPAMMRKLTELRKSFNRDLMLSFNGDMFYYASDTPDGFLRPGRKSLKNEHLLEQLYREIDFCQSVSDEMECD
ncbi:MAG: DUF3137 domain-containing protein [Muribaculaceae bacterium]|nr:DUF3137 domain-containing protein [Muribaculaceae bacterium]